MSGVFGIGTSALLAYQRAIAVTGQNIANVGNEDYSRQRIDLATRNPQFSGAGWYGQGVDGTGVNRMTDQFVQRQVLDNTAGSARQQVYYQYAQRADSLLADPEAGLAPVLQQFFSAVQDVANDPTSTSARQVLLSQGEALSDRFAFLQRRLDDQRQVVEGQIGAAVEEVNGLARSIADLNRQIAEGIGQAGGAAPNDLLDQRDAMIEQLSGLVSVQTLPQGDGTVNVLIGNGQNLVMGSTATALSAQPLGADPSRTEIALLNPGSVVPVTDIISGGELGALLDVRREILDPAQNALGRTAVGLALSFNELHSQGVDLDGVAGGDFFRLPDGEVLVGRGNSATGTPALTYTDAAALTTADYRASFDGVEWRLTRAGSTTPLATAAPGGTLAADGFELDLSGIAGAAAGDSFDVRPTRTAAAELGLAITDPRAFAAALPPATPGASVVGDNRNALALAGLGTERVLANGTTSISASYNELVAGVGVKTRQAELSAAAQGRMLEASQAQRESVSGVNLDEEAANLLRYQQAYAAAAQVIATAGTLFDTLLMAVRR
jgi:flagellar hook-associated protein 1 FlgK